MKYRRLVGLCLSAVFVLSVAGTTSGAQAAEYGTCIKVVQVDKHYKGDYSDKNCQDPVDETGEYEWAPDHIVAPDYTMVWKGVSLDAPALDFDMKCKEGTGSGEITGTTTGYVSFILSGCASPAAGGKCNSPGSPDGVIKPVTLSTELTEEAPGVVYTKFNTWPYGYIGEFECNKLLVRFKGSLGGLTTKINAMEDKHVEAFVGEPGETGQDLLSEDSITEGLSWRPGPGSIYPEGAPSSAGGSIKESDAEKWEIKAL